MVFVLTPSEGKPSAAAWDYPLAELPYLLDEFPNEAFILARDDGGEWRLFEAEEA